MPRDLSDKRNDPAFFVGDWGMVQADGSVIQRGISVVLEGGPFAGRVARLHDAQFSLWVGTVLGCNIVISSTERPAEPDGGSLVGHYSYSEEDEALGWHPLVEAPASPCSPE